MAEETGIGWCDSTFNGWLGCIKVDKDCEHCYAEVLMDHQWNKAKWGPAGPRVKTSEFYWDQPNIWNRTRFGECSVCGMRTRYEPKRDCAGCGNFQKAFQRLVRRRVFAFSLADPFEDRPELVDWRRDFLRLATNTENLDWLVLTKRPENIESMLPSPHVPDNIAIGTSVGHMKAAEKRIPHLLKVNQKVKWLSVEPMLERMDLSPWLGPDQITHVVCGAESGPNRRVFDPDWLVDLYSQCRRAGITFFAKQGGALKPGQQAGIPEEFWNVKEFPVLGKGLVYA